MPDSKTRSRFTWPKTPFIALAAWTLAITTMAPSAAVACDATVSADGGASALQAAIDAAGLGQEVCVTPGTSGQLTLSGSALVIAQDLILTGPGSDLLTIDAAGLSRILDIGASTTVGDVRVSGFTLVNGTAIHDGNNGNCGTGGSIRVQTAGGTTGAVFEDLIIENSECEAIRIQIGSSTLRRSVIRNTNPGPGLVIASGSGTHRIVESALVDNISTLGGGGIVNGGSGVLSLVNSTVSGNQARFGGGIWTPGSNLRVFNSTITNNLATDPNTAGAGGGIGASPTTSAGTVQLHNSIVGGNADSFGASDCGGQANTPAQVYQAGDFNLFETGGGCTTQTTDTEVAAVAAQIGALTDNGGPAPTHALVAGSAASDAGAASCADDLAALQSDQRGAARPVGSACDIGAHEAGPPVANVAPLAHDFGSVEVGDSEMTLVTLSNDGNDTLTLANLSLSGSNRFAGSLPSTPFTLHFDETADVELTFTPTASGVETGTLSVDSDGSTLPVEVALSGEGVSSDPVQQLQDLLDFVDASLLDGSLFGVGPGNSSAKRPKAFRNKIAAAGDLLGAGLIDDACEQLLDVRNRADDDRRPPDFVGGPAASDVIDRVDALRTDLGCS